MVEPAKPFACTMPDCGMTFTNEDHLHVHTKKHDMVLSLGMEQKAAFVADQTPTPTRFIRNCEEVGLFQDLQNVNPFDEGFKRAMETKHGILSLESALASSSDELHTPQMVFPLLDGDSALFSTTNNQRNITISRSSSDESGAVKEFETTTISKLTNEVTTISRIVGKTEEKVDERNKDIRKDSVSYTNNVIKISNLVRKDSVEKNPVQTLIYEDTVIRDGNVVSKEHTEKLQEVPPIMSQKSLDFIVDSLNSDFEDTAKKKSKANEDDYEVIIKLPNGKQVRMRAVDEVTEKTTAKEALKKVLTDKVEKNNLQRLNNVSGPSVVPIATSIPAGTLIPVTLVPSVVQKVPITPLKVAKVFDKKPVKRKVKSECVSETSASAKETEKKNGLPKNLDSRSAASRRYRARLKESWVKQAQENEKLRELNGKLLAERAFFRTAISEHLKKCPDAADLRKILEKI
ncbi:uncharacterized protein LOC113499958 isoform X1 [Trichoplusia ni]|uniref:Uncharacterized protein LOC113499958 isoform X1 n=1 Tax=Trichoplusia ni TaxID=7111 RepID=A0A7E5W796_TRINI|nr:uncharacterized protein LOC113499958 isoform X1 [Trichoplusia ni]